MESDCPSEPDLVAFHLGKLPDEEVDRVAEHIDACSHCEAAVQRLETGVDPLLAALRRPPSHASSLLDLRVRQPQNDSHRADAAADGSVWPELPGYEISGVLGRGGMGIVYQGRQVSLNRLVALKCLRMGSQKEAARSRVEAEALGRLQHPYIVQIYEVVEHDERVYLALEFVAGGSLDDKLTGKPQACDQAANLIELVARAVHYAHCNGIIHRDLKPANVLLARGAQESELRAAHHGARTTAYGLPKIADFGIAKWLAADSGATEHGDVLGTASYMAPEQAAGNLDEIGPATDVYSLGVMLYELLTGRVPLQGTTTLETLALVRGEDPVPPRRLQPQIPRDLETICLKCLEKEPSGRYVSAEALADDLLCFVNREPIRARPITFWERGWKWARRRPSVAALSVALLLTGIIGVASVTWQWRQALTARTVAEQNEHQIERLSAGMMLNQASTLCESGDVARGLLWFVQALQTSIRIGDPDLERVARLNLAAWRPFLIRQRCECRHGGDVTTAVFSPRGDTLLSGGADAQARLWNATTGDPLTAPLLHQGPVYSVAYSPDGNLIATGSGGEVDHGEARLWQTASGEPLGAPLKHAGPVSLVAFCGDGETLLTVCPEEARLWSTNDCQPIGAPLTHEPVFLDDSGQRRPMTAVVSADGKLIATGGCDKMVRLWNAATAKPIGEPLLATNPVVVLAFSPDGQTVLAGSSDGGVRMWDVASGERRGESLRLRGRVRTVAFSPDGKIAAAAGAVGYDDREPSGEVQLCQVETGQNLGAALAHPRPVRTLAFSPTGRLLLTGCEDGQARFFLTATGAQVGKPLPHGGPLTATAFSRDGRTALTATAGHGDRACLRLWEAPPEHAFGKPLVQPGELMNVAFSADGAELLSVTRDGDSRHWQLASNSRPLPSRETAGVALASAMTQRMAGAESGVEYVVFSPDGLSALVVATDNVARLRDRATGKTIGPPLGRDSIRAVAFDAAGERLAVAGLDGKIAVWDAWAPLAGTAERVRLTMELLTGMELVSHESVRELSAEHLHERHRRLEQLGGPLPMGSPPSQ